MSDKLASNIMNFSWKHLGLEFFEPIFLADVENCLKRAPCSINGDIKPREKGENIGSPLFSYLNKRC
ncbi:MAG: hypothetical protein D6785_13175 [Planctomycetota bacterium]|nr:MAG: hypothetical protein D6785_13175 [Planctomycetota bacterium]